jgi:phospholipase C
LYGLFPGANGIANATPEQYVQVDRDGKPLPYLPPVWKGKEAGSRLSERAAEQGRSGSTCRRSTCPLTVPDARHDPQVLSAAGADQRLGATIASSKVSDSGALPMGYYDGSSLPMWNLAREYVLADNFFMGCVRRFVPQSFLARVRLHAVRSECPGRPAREARWDAAGSERTPDSPRRRC